MFISSPKQPALNLGRPRSNLKIKDHILLYWRTTNREGDFTAMSDFYSTPPWQYRNALRDGFAREDTIEDLFKYYGTPRNENPIDHAA